MGVIQEKLRLLPDTPGVYIMLDRDGTVIYVGKARVLKNRVRQYFHSSYKADKVQAMVDNIADFSYVVTPTEVDALALENNLIKKYKPKYNILLKDDKTYPYIKVHTREEFPRISVTRRVRKDGCAHLCTKEEYAVAVEKTLSFLSGNYGEAEKLLREKMASYAEEEQFELAMECRERLEMLSKLQLKRITAMPRDVDADVWAFRTNGLYTCASVLVTRGGMMQGSANFTPEAGAGERGEAVLSFLIQYYTSHEFPHEIVLDEELDDELLRGYAREKAGRNVEIVHPKLGVKRELADMAAGNAKEFLEKSVSAIQHKDDMTKNACARLQELLNLKRYPRRMECYDISNISGVDKVGSMVVFSDGEPDKYSYRRFRIRTVEGANDFASLQEVLRRRLSKLGTDEEDRFPKPQLIIIDGGKGQLSSVREIFEEMGVDDIELISLAKREEEVFTLFSDESVKIDHRDYALRMLQRIRDEAHRFAITYFRNLHSKRNLASVLNEIEGVGKVKRVALMEKFGTIDRIMRASEEELAATEGIGKELAARIKHYFEEKL